MKKSRWEKIEYLCLEALKMAPEERSGYLKTNCAKDPELLSEVESLMMHCDTDSSFLEKPFIQFSHEAFFSMQSEESSIIIGPYRIIRTLAKGGMGEVYLTARNDEAYERFAALKVIRKELDTDEFMNRFYSERQILATLNHPNIARLFEGGTTTDGLPWFAMEYIEGLPVTEYCDRHSYTINGRLDLFIDICSAVQYAHQNLVVHRDLKPGNILITKSGEVKLLDFGIAKLLDQPTDSDKDQTQQQLMTPEYAAPEQVKNRLITTSADIYSLGVLLFELLSGKLPYQWESKTPMAIETAICNQEPDKPSALFKNSRRDSSLLKEIAKKRSVSPDQLNKKLTGDLDAIVLKALQKEPENRFTTVEQFSEDIHRYRRGLPVHARADSVSYRTNKFVRRHRIGVGSAAAFILLMLSFSFITVIQSSTIKAGAIKTEIERERAEKISEFLIDLFKSTDPSEAVNASITARELLVRGADRIEEELHDQSDLRSELLLVIAHVYQNLGLFVEAEELSRKSLDLRTHLYGHNHPDVASAMNTLGWLKFLQGNYFLSDSILSETLALRKINYGENHLDVARTMNDLAVLKQAMGDYTATDSLLNKAIAIRREQLGSTHEAVGVSLSNYAALKWRMGDLDSAEEYMGEVLEILQSNLGNEDLRVAIAMTNLGAILLTNGDYNSAEDLYRQALAIRYKLVGEEHPDVAQNLAHLGNLLRVQGSFKEAEELLLKALDLRRHLLGASHILVGDSKRNIGQLYTDWGNYKSALEYFVRAENLLRKELPAGHIRIGDLLYLKGSLFLIMDMPKDANPVLKESLEIRTAHFGPDDSRTVTTIIQLGVSLSKLDKPDEARVLLQSGLEILYQKASNQSNELIATAERILGEYE